MELKDLEMQYKALWLQIEKLKATPEIDFSKYIRIFDEIIAIMWNKMLKNLDWRISYDNDYREDYNKTPKYTLTKLSELEVGDVFIAKDYIEDMGIENFRIFMWQTKDRYITQYLDSDGLIEYINWDYLNDCEVYKFLRD